MSFWRSAYGFVQGTRVLLHALLRGSSADRFSSVLEPLEPLRPRVLLIVYDPVIPSEGGQKLTQILGWHDVRELTREYISDLEACSGGFLQYRIVEHLDLDEWPIKSDGFRYDEHTYLRCWRSGSGWHQPDAVDYAAIIRDLDLLGRIQSESVDEVWLFGFPYAGFYESIMVGPDAFWCNAPPVRQQRGISRRFVIMGFNYERHVGPMLESFGHRVESHLKHVWRHHRGDDNLWERFIRYDQIAPGQANCGWMHYAPNSTRDYEWDNARLVVSNCDDWLNFPDFQGSRRQVNCHDWGDGDMRAHHKWWLERLPKAHGKSRGILNNWWLYGVDPNAVV